MKRKEALEWLSNNVLCTNQKDVEMKQACLDCLNLKQSNYGLMVSMAFRYALGRMSYIVGFTVEYIVSNIEDLETKYLIQMVKEIEEAVANGYVTMDTDKKTWLVLRKFLMNEIDKRDVI